MKGRGCSSSLVDKIRILVSLRLLLSGKTNVRILHAQCACQSYLNPIVPFKTQHSTEEGLGPKWRLQTWFLLWHYVFYTYNFLTVTCAAQHLILLGYNYVCLNLLKTGSLDNVVRKFLLAQPSWVMSPYTMLCKYGNQTRDVCGVLVLVQSNFLYFGGFFNKTIIPFALVGFEIGYSQLGPTGLIGYLLSHNARSRNNC